LASSHAAIATKELLSALPPIEIQKRQVREQSPVTIVVAESPLTPFRDSREIKMTEGREWLIQWLRDAHAMEEQAETMLSGQLSRLENYPELSNRIKMHLEETKGQAARLKTCLDAIGEGSSSLKDAGGKLMAMGQSISGVFAGDEVMKGSLASYTFEHMEIASYSILVAAANALGETEIARACEENLREEEAMAEWLKSHIAGTTEQFLARAESDADSAKR
jgi:ferritin-like metal-binding protein YciE